ncbi:MAG: hypothetical protein CM1200mP40_03750 [Gammaproteobacteria bacterium]|nr:MAG: hypothetical protein CM1200mP40_03750 [Gammaproteobacteria bacterium]
MTRKYIVFLSVLLFSLGLHAAEDDGCAPFELQGGRISIPIKVVGSDTSAFINTGTRTIGISSSLADRLGLEVIEPNRPVNPRFSGMFQQFGVIENLPIEVFGQEIELPEAYVFNSDQPVANFSLLQFQNLIVQVDNPQSKICFINREALPLDDAQNIEKRTSRTGSAAVEITLNGNEDVWVELELGFAGALAVDYFTAMSLDFVEEGVEAENPSTVSNADAMQFGPYKLGAIGVRHPTQRPERSRFTAGLRTASSRRGLETNGQIGYEILQHFILTMDFGEERMHVFAP